MKAEDIFHSIQAWLHTDRARRAKEEIILFGGNLFSSAFRSATKKAGGIPTTTEMAQELLTLHLALTRLQKTSEEEVLLAESEVYATWLRDFWKEGGEPSRLIPTELRPVLGQAQAITAEEIVEGERKRRRSFNLIPRNSSELLRDAFTRLHPNRFGKLLEEREEELSRNSMDLDGLYHDAWMIFDNKIGAEARGRGFSKALSGVELPTVVVESFEVALEHPELRQRYYTARKFLDLWLKAVGDVARQIPNIVDNRWVFNQDTHHWEPTLKAVEDGEINPREVVTQRDVHLSFPLIRLEEWRQAEPTTLEPREYDVLRHTLGDEVFDTLFGDNEKVFQIATSLRLFDKLGFDPSRPADRVVMRVPSRSHVAAPHYIYLTNKGDVAIVSCGHDHIYNQVDMARSMAAAEARLLELRATDPFGENGPSDAESLLDAPPDIPRSLGENLHYELGAYRAFEAEVKAWLTEEAAKQE